MLKCMLMRMIELLLKKPLDIDQLAGSLYPGYKVKGLAEELDRERKVGER